MSTAINIAGQRFGRLYVVKKAKNVGRYTAWLCRCDCGNKIAVKTQKLTCSHTKSCGCLKIEKLIERSKYSDPTKAFWKKVIIGKPDECWSWKGKLNSGGYGAFCGEGAHVFAFKTNKKLLPGKHVLHTCDNPMCCNPQHLFSGTQSDNWKDALKKGRTYFQRNPNARPRGEKHKNAKLSWKKVRRIRKLYATGKYKQVELAEMFESTQAGISQIVRNVSWARE